MAAVGLAELRLLNQAQLILGSERLAGLQHQAVSGKHRPIDDALVCEGTSWHPLLYFTLA